MDKFIINGGIALDGEVQVDNAKNSVLPLLAASILTQEQVILHNCPKISDVYNMIRILEAMGCKVAWQGNSILVDSSSATGYSIDQHYGKEIRSSIFLLGSILGRFKKAEAVFPGGCDIGLRPIDLHLKGLRDLNIVVEEEGATIFCNSENAKAKKLHFDFPSVGATENVMLAAVLVSGKTTITNCAKEPEIVALQDMLNKMGGNVSGAGSSVIEIQGVKELHGVEFTPIPDRIVAGTYLIAAAMTGGKVNMKNINPCDIQALTSKLNGVACDIVTTKDGMFVKGYKRPSSVLSVDTSPFPGFPTDLQAQFVALQSMSEGVSMITENIFETRFKYIGELKKMGAQIMVRDRYAIVRGVSRLFGAKVLAQDLRGGAALVLAALAAEGQSVVENVYHIDRGYCNIEKVLKELGASIIRVQE